jgi:hypothetical protein
VHAITAVGPYYCLAAGGVLQQTISSAGSQGMCSLTVALLEMDWECQGDCALFELSNALRYGLGMPGDWGRGHGTRKCMLSVAAFVGVRWYLRSARANNVPSTREVLLLLKLIPKCAVTHVLCTGLRRGLCVCHALLAYCCWRCCCTHDLGILYPVITRSGADICEPKSTTLSPDKHCMQGVVLMCTLELVLL